VARFNKSRKPKVQPLTVDVATELKAYLKGKPKGEAAMRNWGGTQVWHSSCDSSHNSAIADSGAY
jgi:hypothetical protein